MIKIKGHSNNIVKFEDGIIKKINVKNDNRFLKNSLKQESMYNNSNEGLFSVPKILHKSEYLLEMEYINNSKTILEIIECETFSYLFEHIEHVIKIINYFVSNSIVKDVTKEIFCKIVNLHENLNKKFNVEKYIKFSKKICKDINIPIGMCHGDFTYSNILLKSHDFYLFDFLDSFVESPLLDIVKIRQDTQYQWIFLMNDEKYDFNKIKITFSFFDNFIDRSFQTHSWYKKHYALFQIMNFLRILQYTTNEKTTTFVLQILDELYNTHSQTPIHH